MQYAEGFILKDCSLVCSQCQTIFGMRVLADLPPVFDSDPIEADLHRVLPHPALRGALISVCPSCGYADWTTKFNRSIINPVLVPPAPEIAFARKFAMAVKHARARNIHPLDIAYMAVNGLYCAREAGESDEDWLELCVFEQDRGLRSEDLFLETAADHLLMAELWRQIRYFDNALAEYSKAMQDESIPVEVIRQQMIIARAGDSKPTRLPPWMVRLVYPEAAELAMQPNISPEISQRIIVHNANPFAFFKKDEATGALVLPSPDERPRWAHAEHFDLELELAMEDQFGGEIDREAFRQLEETILAENPAAAQIQPIAAAATVETAETVAAVAVAQEQPAEETAVAAVQETTTFLEAPAPVMPVPQQEPQPLQVVAPTPAVVQMPVQQPVQQPVRQPVAVAEVKQVISMPEGVSTISLVKAGSGAISIAISPSVVTRSGGPPEWAQSPNDPPTNAKYAGGQKPDLDEKDPTHRAVKRALKAVKGADPIDPAAEFPGVQICDEDSGYAYTPLHKLSGGAPQEEEQPQQVAASAGSSDESTKNPQQAIAQVESFLSLTRQQSYQNWIRGYRK